jgi:pantothenate synthetase
MSSRNRQLGPAERQSATALVRALRAADHQIAGGARDVHFVKAKATADIPQDGSLRLEYLEIVDPHTLQPVDRIAEPVLVAGAMWAGATRLIDNLVSTPPAEAKKL